MRRRTFNARRDRNTRPKVTGWPVTTRISYLGWLAAILGGALFVAQGVFMMAWDYNLDALPLALLLFSVGLATLRGRLRRRAGLLGRSGGLLAYIALAASVLEFVALLLMAWSEDIFWPIHTLGLALGLLAVTLGSALLGLAAFRSGSARPPWGAVILATCFLWVPAWLLGEWVGDQIAPSRELSLGFVPAGFSWVLLGYAISYIREERPRTEPTIRTPTTC